MMLCGKVTVLLLLSIPVLLLVSPSTLPILTSVSAYPAGLLQVMGTSIVLNVSAPVIFVAENFGVRGFLAERNGVIISYGNVTVSWAGRSVVLHTGWDGGFALANMSFPVGFPAGYANITATYVPGNPSFLGTQSSVQVQVLYRPSILNATLTPERGRPLDVVSVAGVLLGSDGTPLEDRNIAIKLDDTWLGNVATNASGSFRYNFTIPQQLSTGSYMVLVSFEATHDAYAKSNATLPLIVEPSATATATATTTAITSPLSLNVDPTVFSGMGLTVGGKVCGGATMPGEVTVYLDRAQAGAVPVNPDGTFQLRPDVPMLAGLGVHSVKAVYSSNVTLGQSCEATATVFVLSTPLIIAGAVIMVSTIATFALKRKGKKGRASISVLAPEPLTVTPQPNGAPAKPVTAMPLPEKLSLDGMLASIDIERDYAAKVTRTYRLAQDLVRERLGISPETNETHREYCDRVMKTAAYIAQPLHEIVELFELAAYKATRIDEDQCRNAISALTKLFQELENTK